MKTLKQFLIINFLLAVTFTVSAQNLDSLKIQQKLDSLIVMQKQLKAMQNEIYKATVYVDPLIGKKFGIEVNPASLFAGNFTGGLQLFNLDRKAEISIPVSYFSPYKIFGEDNGESELNIDFQYRRFIGEHQNGFWVGGGARFTHANENEYFTKWVSNEYYSYNSTETRIVTNNYFGVMAGIGYRYYTQSGFYWGTSISAGKYLNVKSPDYNNSNYSGTYRSSYFYDFELMKIGFTF